VYVKADTLIVKADDQFVKADTPIVKASDQLVKADKPIVKASDQVVMADRWIVKADNRAVKARSGTKRPFRPAQATSTLACARVSLAQGHTLYR